MPQPDSGDKCCDCPSRASPCDNCVASCPTVTFSGVTFCCFDFTSLTEPPNTGGEQAIGITFYANEDCTEDIGTSQAFIDVQVALISGIWHVLAGSLSNNWIFFYGTTANLSVPAVNSITCTGAGVTLDNALTACFFGGAHTFDFANAGGGIATFS